MALLKDNIFVVIIVATLLLITVCSSNPVKPVNLKIKQTAVEFAQNPSSNSLKITPPEKLMQKDVELDVAVVSNDSIGINNLLTLYVFFNNACEDTLTVKVLTNQNDEKASISVVLSGIQDETKPLYFHFNKNVSITENDKLLLQ